MTRVEKGLDILIHNRYNFDLTFSQSALFIFVLLCVILLTILFTKSDDEYDN